MTDQQQAIEKYVDASMFRAEPMDLGGPKVYLLDMSSDPLASIAAACLMYEGKPVHNLSEITDEQRWHYAEQVGKTHLKAPLEFVKFHFMIEGVDRAFTHQMVRQRTAVFAQESLRFAVKDNMGEEVTIPPSIAALPENHPTRQAWDSHLLDTEMFYNYLIGNGIPAEDARAIMPHNVKTRLHYATDLRNLSDHAGNRLCTQAQFAWREVFNLIVEAIRDYSPEGAQLASLPLFKPVCYQLGKCPFEASFDRGCTIRERVEGYSINGVPSKDWDKPLSLGGGTGIGPILDEEWMLDEKAAWQ
jgi:flavin-dependent thymidylate synthase